MSNVILCGDAEIRLRELPSESVQTCITSPPYYNLRDYGTQGQIGMEETPEAYIERLVRVFREVQRVLRPDGTLWVNIGDGYATRSAARPPTNTRNKNGHTEKHIPSGYKQKDLIGIPWMLAFALRADGWYLRQDIIWNKPNAMPESVKSRCTKSHEYIFLLSKQEKYFFDSTAIREPCSQVTIDDFRKRTNLHNKGGKPGTFGAEARPDLYRSRADYIPKDFMRNKRDVWTINTGGFRGAHFAVFPEKLVEPCILAGCPEGGTVIDPFTGSGTTGVVAKRMGRNFIGIEINPEYCEMAERRIEETQPQCEQITIAFAQGART